MTKQDGSQEVTGGKGWQWRGGYQWINGVVFRPCTLSVHHERRVIQCEKAWCHLKYHTAEFSRVDNRMNHSGDCLDCSPCIPVGRAVVNNIHIYNNSVGPHQLGLRSRSGVFV